MRKNQLKGLMTDYLTGRREIPGEIAMDAIYLSQNIKKLLDAVPENMIASLRAQVPFWANKAYDEYENDNGKPAPGPWDEGLSNAERGKIRKIAKGNKYADENAHLVLSPAEKEAYKAIVAEQMSSNFNIPPNHARDIVDGSFFGTGVDQGTINGEDDAIGYAEDICDGYFNEVLEATGDEGWW